MNEAVSILMDQLKQLSRDQTPVNIASLMIHFTIDFLTTTMFNENYYCVKDFDKPLLDDEYAAGLSEGKIFLNEMNIATKEFMLNQISDPFRQYCFWNKGVRRGKLASKRLGDFGFRLLQKRHSHF